MTAPKRLVRQTLSLPASVAKQLHNMAKSRRLSANCVLVELVEEVIEVKTRKQQEFLNLAERSRAATDPRKSNGSTTRWAA
jgi:hypothetical protein